MALLQSLDFPIYQIKERPGGITVGKHLNFHRITCNRSQALLWTESCVSLYLYVDAFRTQDDSVWSWAHEIIR